MSNPYINYASPDIKNCSMSDPICNSLDALSLLGKKIFEFNHIIDYLIDIELHIVVYWVCCDDHLKDVEKAYSEAIKLKYIKFFIQ